MLAKVPRHNKALENKKATFFFNSSWNVCMTELCTQLGGTRSYPDWVILGIRRGEGLAEVIHRHVLLRACLSHHH